MRSVDTNVLIRYLVQDDAAQFALARALIEQSSIFVGVTVILEAEWVLRDGYGLDTDRIVGAFRHLMGLPMVNVEEPAFVAAALDGMDAGLEFADAFHLARSVECEDLVTFDRKFAKRAKTLDAVTVTLLSN